MSFSYARREDSSFVLLRPGPYLGQRMKRQSITPAQLYALELKARRARSIAQAELLKAAVRALKSGITRALSALKLKGLGHA
jgi:hypothetical protein